MACEHFLKKHQRQIDTLVTETLEGHQRGIMGTMTVEVSKQRQLLQAGIVVFCQGGYSHFSEHMGRSI